MKSVTSGHLAGVPPGTPPLSPGVVLGGGLAARLSLHLSWCTLCLQLQDPFSAVLGALSSSSQPATPHPSLSASAELPRAAQEERGEALHQVADGQQLLYILWAYMGLGPV